MGHEPLGNIGVVCDKCASRPQTKYAEMPAESFVGAYVKLAFATDSDGLRRGYKWEHMWVKVTATYGGNMLVGLLDNDPVFCTGVKFKDAVFFTTDLIEDAMHV